MFMKMTMNSTHKNNFAVLRGKRFFAQGKIDFAMKKFASDIADVEAQLYMGRCYEEDSPFRHYPSALLWYLNVAYCNTLNEQTMPIVAEAMYRLGRCHEMGIGVPANEDEAISWYAKASEYGSVRAARTIMLKAGECNPAYRIQLARLFEKGYVVKKDCQEAFRILKMTADEGNLSAINELARCYEMGIGVDKDLKEAFRLYSLASDKGNAAAMINLGFCYKIGRGVEQDIEKARQLYIKAARNGCDTAKDLLLVWDENK